MGARVQSFGCVVACWLVWSLAAYALPHRVRVCVTDERGAPIAGARIEVYGSSQVVLSDASGCGGVDSESQTTIEIVRDGFVRVARALGDESNVMVVMHVAGTVEEVEVTAARSPLALDASASSVRTVTGEQLREAPGFTLDDRLRQVAGFQLFRRTSSWVANPTTEGTTLRGLGSTAASRTLVLSDQVPLNDAYGGWIHWSEIPAMAVQDVELMRGGASDLYGSSAIGGVIDVVPVIAQKQLNYGLNLAGGTENTSMVDGVLVGGVRGWSGLGAASLFRTGGYILTAPEFRGSGGYTVECALPEWEGGGAAGGRDRGGCVCAGQRAERGAEQWDAVADEWDSHLAVCCGGRLD